MADQEIKQQYVSLIKLLNTTSPNTVDQKQLKETYAFCSQLYELTQAQPDLLFAQPMLYKKNLPYVVNITFNACMYTLLFCARNKFDSTLTKQLMCASVSLYSLEQRAVKAHYNPIEESNAKKTEPIGKSHPRFLTLLKHFKQNVWLKAYGLCGVIHQHKSEKIHNFSPICSVTYLANRLALLTTPNKKCQHLSFSQAIKHLTMQCPASWYELISPIIRYPGLVPPGSYVKHKSGSLNVVVALTEGGLITKLLRPVDDNQPASNTTGIQELKVRDLRQSYASQSLAALSKLSEWWNEEVETWLSKKSEVSKISAIDKTLPLQHAPPSLLVLQDQLAHSNVDIAVVTKALEKEPLYVEQVLSSASISNRQKQTVHSVQHGLAMLGLERSSNLLLQYCLLARLNQQYFPLQQAFLNFGQLMASIAEQLCKDIKHASPDTCSTLTYFALSRLFSLPSFRLLTSWDKLQQATFRIDNLVDHKDNGQLKKDAILLAKAWQQPEHILATLQSYDLVLKVKPSKKSLSQLSYILGLSLLLAREVYFSDYPRDTDSNQYLKQALETLGIENSDIEKIKRFAASNSGIYCRVNQ